ncbi:hypothetical protein Tco_1067607 [Tanacetum coccineum]|uniref:Uncharacterized protein n=1 Tax=Tanacetum coccineum TaxID=301880 RepID=A0ABQ5HF67_9ASTR
MESLNSNSQERELHQLKLEARQMYSNNMTCFKELESHLRSLYQNSFVHVENPKQVEMAFLRFFGKEHQIFRKMMLQNLDQLRLQFERKTLHAINAKSCLKKLQIQFQEFFDSEEVTSLAGIASLILQENLKDYMGYKLETYRSNLLKYLDILAKCIDKRVYKYYEILVKEREIKEIKETGKLLNKTISHVHEIQKSFKLQSKDVLINSVQAVDASLVVTESSGIESKNNSSENALNKSVNETQMQMHEVKVDMGKALDPGLVVTKSSGIESIKQDTSSKSGNGITYVMDAIIRLVYDQVPFAKVQLTAQPNVLANEQRHFVRSEPIYDTHLMEKVDSNTTPNSTNMCHRGGEINQNSKKCQVSCPLLDPSFDNMTTKCSNQSLESENISLKKTVAQLQKDFSRMEAHCVNMELKYQQQALKDGQHENEKLHKENEHLKETYKDLYDSIKNTRVQTKDHNDSLIAQINSKTIESADLKAQIQEKVLANIALKKNELRKLKGNSVDTKFAKPSILGKPVSQPPRNQSVVRQPNAFKYE